jgi:7-cyano-7-deazaguanine synthase
MVKKQVTGLNRLIGRNQSVSKKVCVLASGGLDSCVLLGVMSQHYDEVFPVYVRCGLRWEAAEVYWLRRFLRKFRHSLRDPVPKTIRSRRRKVVHQLVVVNLPVGDVYSGHWSLPSIASRGGREVASRRNTSSVPDRNSPNEEVYLPGRNLLLLVKAAVFCVNHGIHQIAMGQLKGNPFPDATPRFLRAAEEAISAALNWRMQVLTPFLRRSKSEVLSLGHHLNLPLECSFSCLAPDRAHRRCGECNKCAEWDKVMKTNSRILVV